MKSFLLISFYLASTFLAAIYADEFTPKTEFPNYFIAEQYRNLPADKIPESEIKRARQVLENALGSIYDRMTLPVVLKGETKAKPIRFFSHIYENFIPAGSNVKIVPSGGVVRSGIGYVYAQIKEGINHGISPEQTLQKIITDKESIPALDIRGVGSDFDLLIISQDPADPISHQILNLTNSAEAKYSNSNNGADSLKSTFFSFADVKNYKEQIERATSQGGRTLDFLAFDVKNKKIIEPPGLPTIVDDLVRGQSTYMAPITVAEKSDKQTIRGMRMYIELPWLTEKDDRQLKKEIQDLLNRAKAGLNPNAKEFELVLDQYTKMMRNARYSGAHNRFYRAKAGSIDALFLELSKILSSKTGTNLLPEFVDSYPLGRDLNGLPKSALMDQARFIAEYTNNGEIYHGTGSIKNALSIMRGGLYVSSNEQGTAALGRGGYTAKELSIAQTYAGSSSGLVFKLKVKMDRPLNILNFSSLNNSKEGEAFYKKLLQQAEKEKRDLHEILARDYGIDAIVVKPDNHPIVLLQNLDMVEIPKGLSPLVEGLHKMVANPELPISVRYQNYIQLESLSRFASDSSGIEFKKLTPKEAVPLLEFGIKNIDGVRESLIDKIGTYEDGSGLDYIIKKFANHPDKYLRVKAMSVIHSHSPERILPYLASALEPTSKVEVFEAAVKYLAEKKIDQPELIQQITNRLGLSSEKALDKARLWASLIPAVGPQPHLLKSLERSALDPEMTQVIFTKIIPSLPKDDELVRVLEKTIMAGKHYSLLSENEKLIRQLAMENLSGIDSAKASSAVLNSLNYVGEENARLALEALEKKNPAIIEKNLPSLIKSLGKEYVISEYLEKKRIPVNDPRYLSLAKEALAQTHSPEVFLRIQKSLIESAHPGALKLVLNAAQDEQRRELRESALTALKNSDQGSNKEVLNTLRQAKAGQEANILALMMCFDNPKCALTPEEIVKTSRVILEGKRNYSTDIDRIFKQLERLGDKGSLDLLTDLIIKEPWGGASITDATNTLLRMDPSATLPHMLKIIDNAPIATLSKMTDILFHSSGIKPEDPRYTELLEKIQSKLPEDTPQDIKAKVKNLLTKSVKPTSKKCGQLYGLLAP